jgi:AraC-like DNA-binding protein
MSHAGSAWRDRHRILSSHTRPTDDRSPEDRPELIRNLIDQATAHDHQVYPVSQAAAAAGISVRHLHRLCMRYLLHPPGTVIDLSRALSISMDLANTNDLLYLIARRHGFARQSDMNRFFKRFVGDTPRSFRSQSL